MKPIHFETKGCRTNMVIPLSHILDHMSSDDAREFLMEVAAMPELLTVICSQIAAPRDQDKVERPPDIVLDDHTISVMREKLAPLLGSAIADELAKARAVAARYGAAERQLREIAIVDRLWGEAVRPEDRKMRSEQFQTAIESAKKMYPDTREPVAPTARIFLDLYHGRTDPNQDMDDWGSCGPIFEVEGGVTGTYGADLKFCLPRFRGSGILAVHDGLVFYDGVWYGDWCVYHEVGETTDRTAARLQEFDQAKADVPKPVGGAS